MDDFGKIFYWSQKCLPVPPIPCENQYSIESLCMILKTFNLILLLISEQFYLIFRAIESIGGLELESDYPYDAKKETCNFNKTLSHVAVKGAVDLPKNETAMAQWLISNGPISIGKLFLLKKNLN